MVVENGDDRIGAGGAGDGFEEALVVRLGAHVQGVGGSPPLAILRAAGRRRARRGVLLRVAAGAAVLLVGVGALTQLESSAGAGPAEPAWAGESGSDDPGGPGGVCQYGPATLRAFTWQQIPNLEPTPPPRAIRSSLERSARHTRVVANAVRSFGEKMYPESWFGACSDLGTNTVYVMRAPGSDLDTALAKAVPHPGVTLEFVDVAGSRKYYDAMAGFIKSTDVAYWAERNVTISDVRISEDGTGLIVFTEQAEAARAEILARYGAELVIEVRPRY
ncbi:hypothetical protein [Kitasatospora sp. NPDC057541]|uniref:hypothetical protein n=1 Tax=unclassified Kitasatospora TaxID=2633591 RepID=UPI0036A06444